MSWAAGKYPVFYLLHGSGDCDDAWPSVGRAGFILDNLIAAKKAKPMIVVMPAGHTTTSTFGGGRGAAPEAAAPGAAPRQDEFYEDFTKDIMPYVEKNYRVLTGRNDRAIAGLSMGGSQTLNVAFTEPGEVRLHRRLQLGSDPGRRTWWTRRGRTRRGAWRGSGSRSPGGSRPAGLGDHPQGRPGQPGFEERHQARSGSARASTTV